MSADEAHWSMADYEEMYGQPSERPDDEPRPTPRRASYRFGVKWIALNDETAELDPEVIAGFISVALLADLFGKTTADVARDVLRARKKEQS